VAQAYPLPTINNGTPHVMKPWQAELRKRPLAKTFGVREHRPTKLENRFNKSTKLVILIRRRGRRISEHFPKAGRLQSERRLAWQARIACQPLHSGARLKHVTSVPVPLTILPGQRSILTRMISNLLSSVRPVAPCASRPFWILLPHSDVEWLGSECTGL